MQVQKSIDIDATPKRVWEFLSDPEAIMQWYTPLQAFEYVGDQTNEVGAPFRFQEKVAGRVMTLECVVTEWTADERFCFEMTSGDVMRSYGETWTVEPVPSGCRFTFKESGELASPLNRVLGPVAEVMSGITVNKMLTRLKTLSET